LATWSFESETGSLRTSEQGSALAIKAFQKCFKESLPLRDYPQPQPSGMGSPAAARKVSLLRSVPSVPPLGLPVFGVTLFATRYRFDTVASAMSALLARLRAELGVAALRHEGLPAVRALGRPWSLVSEAILGVVDGLPTFGATNDIPR
jgi:hypothetical protein